MKKKDILITGAEGFIGKNLQEYLAKKIFVNSVTCIDLQTGADIFSPQLQDYIKKVDVVVHLAARTNVQESFIKRLETYRTNVMGTARVADLCVKHRKKLVYLSSAAVKDPYSSPYAFSKYLAEELLKPFLPLSRVTILRAENVFGPYMNPKNGSIMHRFTYDNPIVVYGDGSQGRDFIHVDDVVRIIVASFSEKWNGKIVEVGMGKLYRVIDIARMFSVIREVDIAFDSKREEVYESKADTKLLRRLYIKKIRTNLEYDIRRLNEKS